MEVTFPRRGFPSTSPTKQEHLEGIGGAFVAGYMEGLDDLAPHELAVRLEQQPRDLVGFAFEGAAMALLLRDLMSPLRRGRWRALSRGDGHAHTYMVHVGAGWALGRLRRRPHRFTAQCDDALLAWLVVDGCGFHEGYFRPGRFFRSSEPSPPPSPSFAGYAARAFDQGLGRSLWFFAGADVERVAHQVGRFPEARRGDLWSGIGLAAAYAGGCAADELGALAALGEGFADHMGQGAAFAAKARQRAGNTTAATELACRQLTGLGADDAAALTDASRCDLPPGTPEQPAYEVWRTRIRVGLGAVVR